MLTGHSKKARAGASRCQNRRGEDHPNDHSNNRFPVIIMSLKGHPAWRNISGFDKVPSLCPVLPEGLPRHRQIASRSVTYASQYSLHSRKSANMTSVSWSSRNSPRCSRRLSNRNNPKLNTVGSWGLFASPAGKYGVIRLGTRPLVGGLSSCRARMLLSMATCVEGESPLTDDLSPRNPLLIEKKNCLLLVWGVGWEKGYIPCSQLNKTK